MSLQTVQNNIASVNTLLHKVLQSGGRFFLCLVVVLFQMLLSKNKLVTSTENVRIFRYHLPTGASASESSRNIARHQM